MAEMELPPSSRDGGRAAVDRVLCRIAIRVYGRLRRLKRCRRAARSGAPIPPAEPTFSQSGTAEGRPGEVNPHRPAGVAPSGGDGTDASRDSLVQEVR